MGDPDRLSISQCDLIILLPHYSINSSYLCDVTPKYIWNRILINLNMNIRYIFISLSICIKFSSLYGGGSGGLEEASPPSYPPTATADPINLRSPL